MGISGSQVKILYGVYDADGGLWGEIKYILGKISGLAHCTLCDMTHGWSLRGKKEWIGFANRSELEFRLLHRNEQPSDLAKITGDSIPCIAQRIGDSYSVIVSPEELVTCEADIRKLETLLASKLGSI
ncbi:MAG: hypothetical protein ACPGN6_09160 [Gammaproteobacteria bacterium]